MWMDGKVRHCGRVCVIACVRALPRALGEQCTCMHAPETPHCMSEAACAVMRTEREMGMCTHAERGSERYYARSRDLSMMACALMHWVRETIKSNQSRAKAADANGANGKGVGAPALAG